MTPQQALQNLFQASRLAPLPADQHQILAESFRIVSEALNPPKKEVKEGEK
jgi:hypothetical protein